MNGAHRPLSPAAAAMLARRNTLSAILAHKARCKPLPRPGKAEVAELVSAFAARGGQITQCPAACVMPVQNGAGLVRA